MVVGLTGGIACGKSSVAQMFEEQGFVRLDADQVAREIVQPGQPTLDAIVGAFGSSILLEDGQLDRAQLGKIIFADPLARARLDAITHPQIGLKLQEYLADFQNRSMDVVLDHLIFSMPNPSST